MVAPMEGRHTITLSLMASSLPPFSEVAEGAPEAFLEAVNVLFETAPPLSAFLLERRSSLDSYEALISAARDAIASLSAAERLEVINAHPRIGVKPSEGELSALSYREQGLDRERDASAEQRAEIERVYAELARLNREYEERFGFRFVVFVNGRSKKELLPVLEARLRNSRDEELATGLEAMLLIAADRLAKLRRSSRM